MPLTPNVPGAITPDPVPVTTPAPATPPVAKTHILPVHPVKHNLTEEDAHITRQDIQDLIDGGFSLVEISQYLQDNNMSALNVNKVMSDIGSYSGHPA